MSEIQIIHSGNKLDRALRHPSESYEGWYFGAGPPEFWKYQEQMLVPDGKLLDIGIGTGRSSRFFGLQGMEVTGVDTDSRHFEAIAEEFAYFDGRLNLLEGDLLELDLPDESFDTVLLEETFIHQDSREVALELLDAAYRAIKPGGHLWVRANGIEDSIYDHHRAGVEHGYIHTGSVYDGFTVPFKGQVLDDGYVIEHPCGCSGTVRQDRTVFFDQLDISVALVENEAEIVHSQVVPQHDTRNIMYGEDFHDGEWIYLSGTISVLVQKPVAEAGSG